MKKWIALLLVFGVVVGLFGCGAEKTGVIQGNEETEADVGIPEETVDPGADMPERVLEVGYGKGNITPTEPMPMGSGKLSSAINGELSAITVAFRDEEGKIYIHVVTDLSWGGMSDKGPEGSLGICDLTRVELEKQLGISPEFVTVGGTHNHSQVVYGNKDDITNKWREEILIPQIVSSVQQALDDLAPAQMYIGTTQTNRLTFVRRYWLNDGTFYDGYRSNRDSEIASHETEADEEIQMVKFVREGKQDILMINWQTHATKASSHATSICPDFPAPLRDQVDADLGVLSVFYQGACGNLAPSSRIASENVISEGGWEGAQKLGKAVAAYVVDAYESDDFTKVDTGLIQMERITMTGQVLKFDSAMLTDAQKVVEYSKTARDNYDTAAFAAQFGIETIYHANSIIANSKLPDTKTYEINMISIGDVAFTTLPMEFFDTTGMQIKDGSPFKMTVLLGYSCSKGQYVPDIEAWQNGGYESYRAYFAPGTAEQAVEAYLESLNELFPTRKGSH